MCAVELVADRSTKASFPATDRVGGRLLQAATDRGLFSRVKGDSFVLAPPAVISEEQLDRAVEILADAIHAVLS